MKIIILMKGWEGGSKREGVGGGEEGGRGGGRGKDRAKLRERRAEGWREGGEGRGGRGSSSRTRRRSHNAALTTEFTPERLRIDQNQRLESTKDLSGTSRDPTGTPPPQ